MSQEIEQLVRSAYDAFNRGDIAAVFGAMDERVEFVVAETSPYDPGRGLIGQQDIVENLFRRIAAEWEGFAVQPQILHAGNDVAVVEGRFAGICKATGRSTNAEFAHIWTIKNGRLARLKEYGDTAAMQSVMPAAGSTAAS